MAHRERYFALAGWLLCACNQQGAATTPAGQATGAAGVVSAPAGQTGQTSAAVGGMPAPAAGSGAAGTGAVGVAAAGTGALGTSSAAGASASGTSAASTQQAADGSDPNAFVLDRMQWQPYQPVSYPPENPFSADKALLGKALFWDEQLSSDDTVACGTCHRGAAGGSDPRPGLPGYLGHPGPDGMRGTADDPKGSPGIAACKQAPDAPRMPLMDPTFGDGPRVLFRRAQTVLDAMFSEVMFWDGRVGQSLKDPVTQKELIPAGAGLEAQALAPILNSSEMACEGRTWDMVSSKIAAAKPLALATNLPPDLAMAQQSAPTYSELFTRAFGDASVTPARIVMAIATYERALTANQTPWDLWLAGDDNAMTDQQKHGFQMFVTKGNCTCCHAPPLFSGATLFDEGFHEHSFDGGAQQIGGMPGDYDHPQFRTVTARNAGLREPVGLLHDGLAPGDSLEHLIAAYNKAPVRSVSVCRRALGLTDAEQSDLVEFVRNALTDPRAAKEEAPFDRPKLASEASEN